MEAPARTAALAAVTSSGRARRTYERTRGPPSLGSCHPRQGRRAGQIRGLTAGSRAETSARREARLEAVDRLDAERVGTAEHREVERDEVAEQHVRHEPLEERLAARRDALDDGRLRPDDLGGQLDPGPHPLAGAGVVEEDG